MFLVLVGFSLTATATPFGKVAENQTLGISCDSGTISSVNFASYGTPSGSNGIYYLGSCNSSNSKSVVQSYCKIGATSCSVKASNSLFGDPCVGTTKSLAVSVTCTVPVTWTLCASENGTCNFTGTRSVRYGANGIFVTKNSVTGPIPCTNAYFGNDPVFGVTKACFYSSTSTSPTPTPIPTPTPTPAPADVGCRSQVPRTQIGLASSGNLHINGQNNVVIDGKAFTPVSGVQNCLYITNSTNVTIKNSSFKGCYRGVMVEGSSNVIIEDNYFENNHTGVAAWTSSNVKVRYNRIKNTGGGSWYNLTTAFSQKVNPNSIQFNKVSGGNNEISCNLNLNVEGQSKSEDLMTTYQSQGTATSPILIQYNCIKGGGPSPSGGGIMIGDQGGKYITAQNNTLINVGQYSLAIAGGHYNKLLNNKIYARERVGFPLDIGIYVHDYGNSLDGTGCSYHTVQGNQVDCIHGGNSCGAAKGNECGPVAGWDTGNNWGIFGTSTLGPNLTGISCPFDY
jgi:parallel beta-helix repeat protein